MFLLPQVSPGVGYALLSLAAAGVLDVAGGSHCTYSERETFYSYTSFTAPGVVYRYDVGPDPDGSRQLPDFATILPFSSTNPAAVVLYALRLLPPGDGTGGVT